MNDSSSIPDQQLKSLAECFTHQILASTQWTPVPILEENGCVMGEKYKIQSRTTAFPN